MVTRIRLVLRKLLVAEDAAEIMELAVVLGLIVALSVTIIAAIGIRLAVMYGSVNSAL